MKEEVHTIKLLPHMIYLYSIPSCPNPNLPQASIDDVEFAIVGRAPYLFICTIECGRSDAFVGNSERRDHH